LISQKSLTRVAKLFYYCFNVVTRKIFTVADGLWSSSFLAGVRRSLKQFQKYVRATS